MSDRPACLDPLLPRLARDTHGRPVVDERFRLAFDGPSACRIYLQNGARHLFGIAEPQLSLMAWRAAVIVNDLAGRTIYDLGRGAPLVDWPRAAEATSAAA